MIEKDSALPVEGNYVDYKDFPEPHAIEFTSNNQFRVHPSRVHAITSRSVYRQLVLCVQKKKLRSN